MKEPFNAGLSLEAESEEPVIDSVRNNSPGEDAGLQAGDEIASLDGRQATKDDWLTTLARHKTGDAVSIIVKRDRKSIKTKIVLSEPDRFEYKIEERMGATPEQKALRAKWFSGK